MPPRHTDLGQDLYAPWSHVSSISRPITASTPTASRETKAHTYRCEQKVVIWIRGVTHGRKGQALPLGVNQHLVRGITCPHTSVMQRSCLLAHAHSPLCSPNRASCVEFK